MSDLFDTAAMPADYRHHELRDAVTLTALGVVIFLAATSTTH